MFNLKIFAIPSYCSEITPNTTYLSSNRITNLLGYMLDALINIVKDVLFDTTWYTVEIFINY